MKIISWFLISVFLFTSYSFAQQYDAKFESYWKDISKGRVEVYFEVHLKDNIKINELSRIISIDRVNGHRILAYANKNEFLKFLSLEVDYTILTPPGMLSYDPVMLESINIREVNDWNFYPTYEAYVDMMYQFETDYPDLCKVSNLGTLPSGRKILAIKITDNPTAVEYEPEFLYTSTMHGDETTGYVLMLRLIDYLLQNYGTIPKITQLVNNMEIWINPNANPDGTYAGGNNTVNGATRGNANGINLNRNYPDPEDGPHPDGHAWQPETIIFMNFAEFHDFVLSANIHGGTEVCNYPWDTWATRHADDDWWQLVCREYADSAQHYSPSGYMTALNNGITNGYDWYSISGGRQDYMCWWHSGREFTLEISNAKLPPASQLPQFWEYNYRSFLGYMKQAAYGVKGIVTDSITGEPIKAKVYIAGHDIDSSWVFSNLPLGEYFRPIYEGTYDIKFSSPGYFPKTIQSVTVSNFTTTVQNVELAPGTLIADFEASSNIVPVEGNIDFNDLSYGEIVAWEWYFEGGDPEISTQENPEGITYHNEGLFNVRLKITNDEGDTNVILKTDYILVDVEYIMNDETIIGCSGIFLDPGGMENNYGNDQDFTMTFIPDNDESVIIADFETFELEFEINCDYDWLKIYDGESTAANMIGKYCGTESPGIIWATNDVGALTFEFHSDQSENAPGWLALISCDSNVGISPQYTNEPLNIWPNPCTGDFVNINYVEAGSLLTIYDSKGVPVWQSEIENSNQQIDVSDLKNGIYFISLKEIEKTRFHKLIIQH